MGRRRLPEGTCTIDGFKTIFGSMRTEAYNEIENEGNPSKVTTLDLVEIYRMKATRTTPFEQSSIEIPSLMRMAYPIEDQIVRQVMHPDDRIVRKSVIDFFVRENVTQCKHLVLHVSAARGGRYILAIYLEGIALANLLKPEWEQFKVLCAEQAIEVTDHDTILFFHGSIYEVQTDIILGK